MITPRRCGFTLKHKSEVFSPFKVFKAMIEKEKCTQVKMFKFDEEGEYFSNEFSDYLKEWRI